MLVIGFYYALHERMSNNIFIGEVGKADAVNAVQYVAGVCQAGVRATG